VLLVLLVGCSDPAVFRPARGVKDLPSVKVSYRIREADPTCESRGFIVDATSIDDLAETAANHGATHYKVIEDVQGTAFDTEASGPGSRFGNVVIASGQFTTTARTTHRYVAEAFVCGK